MSLESDYPYEGKPGVCRIVPPLPSYAKKWHFASFEEWFRPSIDTVKSILMKSGPILTAIDFTDGISIHIPNLKI
jgi:hypothetical protein